MSYLGRSAKLSLKAQEKVSFLATAGQTAKTGLSYVPNFVEVYVNGILLTDTTDFTATNGNSVTFTVALALNDEVTVVSLKTFTVSNTYTQSEADALLAAKLPLAGGTMTGALDVNAAATLGGGTDEIQIIGGGGTARVDAIGGNTNVNLSLSTKGSGKVYFWRGGYGGTQMALLDSDGLKFGADTAAANALDDYEEGTWTPTIGGNSTYNNQVGRYIKIGNMVWVNFAIGINAQGSGSTISQISGLPFTSGLASQNTSNLTWHGLGVAMTYGVYYVGANSTTLSLSYTTGASTQLTNNPNSLVNGASMNGTFVYTI